ncbi:MAG: sulfite exporter TauE/SafE family protein [Betaproteobacteria bacterium]|nr:sulfite exporter TauE/SafE family protein [Betaproteobacteria bacterium]
MEWSYAVSGLLGGFLVGLTGVGGGSLMTPLLVMAFGIPPSTAVGTDLLYAAATKASGVWAHHRKGNVEWRATGLLMLGSAPATLITLVALRNFKPTPGFESGIRHGLALALALTAASLLCGLFKRRCTLTPGERDGTRPVLLTVLLGGLIGVLVTVSSVGAGALGTAVLVALYPKMPIARIVGTDIAHAVPLTLLAGLGHFTLGHVNLGLLGNLLVGSIPGIWLGSLLNAHIPERVARLLLSALLLLIAVKMGF